MTFAAAVGTIAEVKDAPPVGMLPVLRLTKAIDSRAAVTGAAAVGMRGGMKMTTAAGRFTKSALLPC